MQINKLQLKVARTVLNIYMKDLGKIFGVNRFIINRAELGTNNERFLKKYNNGLLEFFKENKIIFPDEYTIEYLCNQEKIDSLNSNKLLTRFQLRAARCITNTRTDHISDQLFIPYDLITQNEKLKNSDMIFFKKQDRFERLNRFFIDKGIEFPKANIIFFKKALDKE